MATYDSPRGEVASNLQSSVGGFLAEQILQALDQAAGGQSDELQIQDNWKPGDPVNPGVDILIVQPGTVSGNVDVPAGVSAMLLTGPGGVQATFNASQNFSLALGTGNDVITVTAPNNGTVKVDLGAGDDIFVGAQNASNFVNGGDGNDTMTGGALGDTFFVGRGSDVVDAGAGFDVALVEGKLSDYDQAFVDGVLTLTSKATGEVTQLSNTEFVSFADGGVIVNVESQDGFVAATLFEALLGRTPDKAGLEFYDGEGSPSAEAVANGMLHSSEFVAQHGDIDAMSNADFINLMYTLALDRAPEADGLNYWLDKLSGGDGALTLSKAQVALQFGYAADAEAKIDILINFDQDNLNS